MTQTPTENRVKRQNTSPSKKKVLTPFSVRTGYDASREALARRLHDQIGQPLTALKFIIGRVAGCPDENRLFDEAKELINGMQIEVRKLLASLQPSPGYPDLLSGLESVVADHNHNSPMKVILQPRSKANLSVPDNITRAVLVFVREVLANISFQPGVAEVSLKVWRAGNNLNIRVADKSSGFNPEALALNCLGLNTVHQAAYMVQGELVSESAPGTGASITARFSLVEQQGRHS